LSVEKQRELLSKSDMAWAMFFVNEFVSAVSPEQTAKWESRRNEVCRIVEDREFYNLRIRMSQQCQEQNRAPAPVP
jgi:hypothetical protein